MPSEGTPQIWFRAGELLPALQARSGASPENERTRSALLAVVARRDLDRYYALLARSLPRFSESEASLLMDAMNGILTRPETAHLLWAEIAASLEGGLAEKWGVDGPALVQRLRQLTPFEALAVADAIERAWHRTSLGETIGETLRAVGLVREERG